MLMMLTSARKGRTFTAVETMMAAIMLTVMSASTVVAQTNSDASGGRASLRNVSPGTAGTPRPADPFARGEAPRQPATMNSASVPNATAGVSGPPAGAPASATAVAPATSTARSTSLGAVRPSNLVLPQFAVSSFAGAPQVGDAVAKALNLADVTSLASNAAAVQAAQANDRASGAVSYDAWTNANVNYVLRGTLNGADAQVELHDIASRQRTFGKSYTNFGDARRLSLRIADDLMQQLTNAPGIFSSNITFLSGRPNKEVAIIAPDGGDLRQLTNERAITASPTVGSKGREIFFTSYRDNNPDLYGVTLDGRRFEVSRRPGLNTAPSWSEAAGRLAVTLGKDGNTEIYTMTRDGRDLERLTNSPDADTAPTWSPDGSQIAFTSDREGSPQIFIMSSRGGGARKVSSAKYCDQPSWSPDGARLAYVVRESGGFNIYVTELATGETKAMTSGGDNTDPSWAPNSRHLVFCRNRDLYLLNTTTKQAKRITSSGAASEPAWGPALN